MAPLVLTGSCNREVMEAWVETILTPVLQPGDKVIMDNASFHKGPKIKALIEAAGCTLVFLPVRSSDLNPIEHFWFPLKHALRKLLPSVERVILLNLAIPSLKSFFLSS